GGMCCTTKPTPRPKRNSCKEPCARKMLRCRFRKEMRYLSKYLRGCSDITPRIQPAIPGSLAGTSIRFVSANTAASLLKVHLLVITWILPARASDRRASRRERPVTRATHPVMRERQPLRQDRDHHPHRCRGAASGIRPA